jgi:hypothetical protein
MTYWHGGSRVDGEWILPGDVTGATRAAGDAVYVTTVRSLAETYASTVDGSAWVFEVEPDGPVEPVPPIIGGPTISFRCRRARIVRRYTISNARRRYLAAKVPVL